MISTIAHRIIFPSLVLTVLFSACSLHAAEFVQVVHSPDPAPLEKLAASELADILERVFNDTETRSGSAVAKRPGTVIFVGNPDTNPNIAREFPDWPKVTDQGIVIRSNGEKKTHAVGGGSPAATLWAVYELGHRLGIRYLLRGDLNPLNKRSFDLSDIEATIEPQVRQRGWETLGAGAHTFESWGLADQRGLLKQLVKMKFNHLILKIEPWHPFVDYEFEGVRKTTGTLWNDRQFPLTGDFVGKKAFAGAKVFSNPDFDDVQTPAARHAAGKQVIESLVKTAQDYGMTVSVRLRRAKFAPEFSSLIDSSPGSQKPGPAAQKLFATEMKAWFNTYPGIDQVSWLSGTSKDQRIGVVAAIDREKAASTVPNLTLDRTIEGQGQNFPMPEKGSRLSVDVHASGLDSLPHTRLVQVDRTLRDAIKADWPAVSIGPAMVTEFGQDVHFVSRAMWDADAKAASTYKDIWATTTGNASAAERLWLGREHLEKASTLISQHDSDYVKVAPGMLVARHYIPKPIPDWWQEVTDAYTQYMIELYRSHGAIDGDAKPYLFYYAKRGEYVLEYMGAVKAVREAALAKEAGDTEAALEHLEQALELTYNCINTLSDIARDQGDRGLIAELNAFAYQPLVAEVERLSEEE